MGKNIMKVSVNKADINSLHDNNKNVNKKIFLQSTLSLLFWLFSSLLIMQQTNAYFSYEVMKFFNLKIGSEQEKLFLLVLYSYMGSVFISVLLVRNIKHYYMLSAGMAISSIGMVLIVLFPTNFTALFLGIGIGFIPSSAVCSVVERLDISPSAHHTRDKHDIQSIEVTSTMRPVGAYLLIPILIAILLALHSIAIIVVIAMLFSAVIIWILFHDKNFGAFTSSPTLKTIFKETVGNIMFYSIIGILIVVSFIDVAIVYCLPYVVKQYIPGQEDTYLIIAILLIMLFIIRIAMILFAELTLIHIPPRRLLLFSSIVIVSGLFIFRFASYTYSKILLLFLFSSALSVVFPSLIKSAAKFTRFSALPVVVAVMTIVGNIASLFVNNYFFSKTIVEEKIITMYSIFGLLLAVLVTLFFILSYKRRIVHYDAS